MKGSEVENPFAQLRSAAFICFIVVFDSLKEPPGQQSICLRIRSASAYFFKPVRSSSVYGAIDATKLLNGCWGPVDPHSWATIFYCLGQKRPNPQTGAVVSVSITIMMCSGHMSHVFLSHLRSKASFAASSCIRGSSSCVRVIKLHLGLEKILLGASSHIRVIKLRSGLKKPQRLQSHPRVNTSQATFGTQKSTRVRNIELCVRDKKIRTTVNKGHILSAFPGLSEVSFVVLSQVHIGFPGPSHRHSEQILAIYEGYR